MSKTPQTIYLKDYQPPTYLIPSVELTIELGETETFVKNKMTLVRNPKSTEDPQLFLNGEELELVDVSIDGEPLASSDYDCTEEGLRIKTLKDEMLLEVKTRLLPQDNKAFSGLYKTKSIFCTQMEAEGFRRMTYFLDRPDVLSKYKTTIVADKKKYPILLSNGNFIETKDVDGEKQQAVWEDPFPKPCYLFALVAGDLDWVEDSYTTISKRKVALKVFVDKGKKDRARFAMNSLKQSMKWDEDTFRLEYDLDIYNIVAVDDFNMGAMENKGLNIFNSKYVLADTDSATDAEFQAILRVIGHEYFHNWSGNRVTCRDWFQLSLKEGLTVFRDQEFTADLTSRPEKRIEDVALLRSRQFPEDAGPMAHPVRPDSYISIDNFYTVTIYEKGAEVIRMIHTLLGPEMFKKGIAKYFELYDGQAVTTDDFVHAMETVSKRDLTPFKKWYDQAGTPEVSVRSQYSEEDQTLQLEMTQKTLDPISKEENKAYHIPIKMGLLSEAGEPLSFCIEKGDEAFNEWTLELTQPKQNFTFTKVHKKPVLSLLRGFSAPIKMNYEQEDKNLYLLLTKDKDSFNRWESGQKIYLKTLTKAYNDLLQNQKPEFPEELTEAPASILNSGSEDPALSAKLLSKPSPAYLMQFIDDVHPHKLFEAYKFFSQEVAKNLDKELREQYSLFKDKKLGTSNEDILLRTYKNAVFQCIAQHDEKEASTIALQQFQDAQNMTDSLAALAKLAHLETPESDQAFDLFYDRWKEDALVMNKWFANRALSLRGDTFEKIQQLIQDPVYDKNNPNNIYSLIYSFASYNLAHFHNPDGRAYQWVAEQVLEIDGRNPQVSSRVASCFNSWKKFAPEFQQAMGKSLAWLHGSKTSKNLFEIIDRALK